MRDNEKARAAGGAAERAAEQSKERTLDSCVQYNTARPKKQGRIERLLNVGEKNAIKSGELIRIAGLRDTRQLRDAIALERAHGALILSTCRPPFGYFLPSSGEQGRREIEAFIKTVHARACNSQIALRTARRALRQLDGQLEMEVPEDTRCGET